MKHDTTIPHAPHSVCWPTWVFVPDTGVEEEPVVEGDQLEEGETRSAQIAKSGRVHLAIQPSTNDGKYV